MCLGAAGSPPVLEASRRLSPAHLIGNNLAHSFCWHFMKENARLGPLGPLGHQQGEPAASAGSAGSAVLECEQKEHTCSQTDPGVVSSFGIFALWIFAMDSFHIDFDF